MGPRQHRVVVNANSMASLEGTNRGNRDLYECKMVVRLTATGVDGVEVVEVVVGEEEEAAGQGVKMRSAWVASGRKVNMCGEGERRLFLYFAKGREKRWVGCSSCLLPGALVCGRRVLMEFCWIFGLPGLRTRQ